MLEVRLKQLSGSLSSLGTNAHYFYHLDTEAYDEDTEGLQLQEKTETGKTDLKATIILEAIKQITYDHIIKHIHIRTC